MLHWALDAIVGICSLLILLALWLGMAGGGKDSRNRASPARDGCVGSGLVVALECGMIVTEVGRQPWIVLDVMGTSDAVTQANGISITWLPCSRVHRARRGARDHAAGDVATVAQRRRGGRPVPYRPDAAHRGVDDRGLR